MDFNISLKKKANLSKYIHLNQLSTFYFVIFFDLGKHKSKDNQIMYRN